MSTIRGMLQSRTILDFSKNKVSKNYVAQALRKVEVLETTKNSEHSIIFIENYIQIGMYKIRILPYALHINSRTKLKEYGGFSIEITETGHEDKPLNYQKDCRFKDQGWIKQASTYQLHNKQLIDIILHCNRLNNLSIFL